MVALMVFKMNANGLLATFIETSKMAKRNQDQENLIAVWGWGKHGIDI